MENLFKGSGGCHDCIKVVNRQVNLIRTHTTLKFILGEEESSRVLVQIPTRLHRTQRQRSLCIASLGGRLSNVASEILASKQLKGKTVGT